jgi:hypothetical protein
MQKIQKNLWVYEIYGKVHLWPYTGKIGFIVHKLGVFGPKRDEVIGGWK